MNENMNEWMSERAMSDEKQCKSWQGAAFTCSLGSFVSSVQYLPSWRYHVLSCFGNASTMHCKRTWLSTGAATNWLTVFTDGGTARKNWENKKKKKKKKWIN